MMIVPGNSKARKKNARHSRAFLFRTAAPIN